MDEGKVKTLGEDGILSLIVRYSTPSIVATIASALYNVADRIFVGRALGEDALASITVCFSPTLFLLALAMTVGQGSATLISIKLGEKNREGAEQVLGQAVFLFFVFYLIASSLTLYFMSPILDFLGATEKIKPMATSYYTIIISGLIFEKISYGVNNLVRAEGRPIFAMSTILTGVVVNIFLDWLFLFVFGWGIEGAAIATVMAQAIASMIVIYFYFGGKSYLRIRLKNIRARIPLMVSMIYAGSPSLIIQGLSSIAVMLFVRQARFYGSESAIAIIGISMTITAFIFFPVVGLSMGIQPIIGYNWGAENMRRVRQTYLNALWVGTAICTGGFIVAQVFPSIIFSLFLGEKSELIPMGERALRLMTLCFPLVGVNIVTSGYFQSIKRPFVSIMITFLRQAIFLVPMLYIMPIWFGIDGIWSSFAVSDFLAFLFTICAGTKELIRLTKRINCTDVVKSVENVSNL